MYYNVGDLVIGKIIKVKPFAFFMSFENGCQALLHISEIAEGFVRDIDKFGNVGDELKVKVLNIDQTNGFMRVSLKQVPAEEAYSTHEDAKKRKSSEDANDFKELESKLPKWIDIALKKIEEDTND